ncbi:hypothetical protein [Lysobacter gummosus]|uniref:hypothetical protein n=1 Tax=Lysobacter gummosus TaxID=262324 RepID=UPI0036444A59
MQTSCAKALAPRARCAMAKPSPWGKPGTTTRAAHGRPFYSRRRDRERFLLQPFVRERSR